MKAVLRREAPDLAAFLEGGPALAVAFSGGLDSRFLCHAALLMGRDVIGLHLAGPHIPRSDTEMAAAWAGKAGLPWLEIGIDPLTVPEVAANGRDRCYFCKRAMFAVLKTELEKRGEAWRPLCDGANLDDTKAWRPGMRAAAEAGVISPLANMGKEDIRRAAKATGMDNPEQKARPCLLTRLAYGLSPTREGLERLAKAEAEIAALLEAKAPEADFRLRLAPEPLLQVSPLGPEVRESLKALLGGMGLAADIREDVIISGFHDRLCGP